MSLCVFISIQNIERNIPLNDAAVTSLEIFKYLGSSQGT